MRPPTSHSSQLAALCQVRRRPSARPRDAHHPRDAMGGCEHSRSPLRPRLEQLACPPPANPTIQSRRRILLTTIIPDRLPATRSLSYASCHTTDRLRSRTTNPSPFVCGVSSSCSAYAGPRHPIFPPTPLSHRPVLVCCYISPHLTATFGHCVLRSELFADRTPSEQSRCIYRPTPYPVLTLP